jgi:hypothetical protein
MQLLDGTRDQLHAPMVAEQIKRRNRVRNNNNNNHNNLKKKLAPCFRPAAL